MAVLQIHPGSGWPSLSEMGHDTEGSVITPFVRETRFPLLGMTRGSDGCRSARFWDESGPGDEPRHRLKTHRREP